MTPHLPSRGDRVAVLLSSLGLLLIGAALVLIISTTWYPQPPLSRLAVRVVNAPTVNGDVYVEVDYCKRYALPPAEVRWALVDGVTVMLPPYTVSLPVGCHVLTVALPLNRSVAPGVYQLQVTGIYRPWPWREIVHEERSAPFRLGPEPKT